MTTYQDALSILVAGRDQLHQMFDAATAPEDMRQLFRAIHALDDEIIAIHSRRLDDSSAAYETLSASFRQADATLQAVQARVQQLVTVAETATAVVRSLTKVVALLT